MSLCMRDNSFLLPIVLTLRNLSCGEILSSLLYYSTSIGADMAIEGYLRALLASRMSTRVCVVSRIVRESDKIVRNYTKTRHSTPRPRACEITEASECLLVVN